MFCSHYQVTRAIRVGFVLGAVWLLPACEQRVVGVKNDWATSSPKITRASNVHTPARKKGFLESIGDFMFGWTKNLSGGEPGSPPARPAPDAIPAPPPSREPEPRPAKQPTGR